MTTSRAVRLLVAGVLVAGCGDAFVAGGGDANNTTTASASGQGGGATSSSSSGVTATTTTGGGGAGGGSAAAGGGGPQPLPSCAQGGIDELVDTFNAGTLDTLKWDRVQPAGMLVGIMGSRAEMRFNNTSSSARWGEIVSRASYSLVDCHALVEVDDAFNPDPEVHVYLAVQITGDNSIAMTRNGNDLRMNARASGIDAPTTIPFEKDEHRWWMIRESGGMLTFETSPDGMSWQVARTVDTPFDVSAVHMIIGLGTPSDTTNYSSEAKFDNVNAPPL
jgi:hypothetical protein